MYSPPTTNSTTTKTAQNNSEKTNTENSVNSNDDLSCFLSENENLIHQKINELKQQTFNEIETTFNALQESLGILYELVFNTAESKFQQIELFTNEKLSNIKEITQNNQHNKEKLQGF